MMGKRKREEQLKHQQVLSEPSFYLTQKGKSAVFTGETESDEPLSVQDVQHLLLHCLYPSKNHLPPSWCVLMRPGSVTRITLFIVEGISSSDYQQNIDCFSTFNKIKCLQKFNLLCSSSEGMDVLDEIIWVPQSKKLISKTNLEETITSGESSSEACCTRSQLLLSPENMVKEGYLLPPQASNDSDINGFRNTKSSYDPVTNASPIFAIDCEMVQTAEAGLELASIAVVNEKLEVVYSSLVKPENPIIDYISEYSGIYPKTLENVTTRVSDVQNALRDLLPSDAILCGHSLNSDLHALKLYHPYVIDTAFIYCLSTTGGWRVKLKVLAEKFLKKRIQEERSGHDAAEDARATMELVHLKLKYGMKFGDARSGWSLEKLSDVSKREKFNILKTTGKLDNVFEKIQTAGIVCGISATEDIMTTRYHKRLPSEESIPDKKKHRKVTLYPQKNIYDVFHIVGTTPTSCKFMLGHIDISDEIQSHLAAVDEGLTAAWRNVPGNGVAVFLFTGLSVESLLREPREGAASGICFVGVKNSDS